MPDKKKKNEVIILTEYCKGCGLCIEVCPEGKLYMLETPNRDGVMTAAVREEADCTACLRCATMCPDAAIEVRQAGVAGEEIAAEAGKKG